MNLYARLHGKWREMSAPRSFNKWYTLDIEQYSAVVTFSGNHDDPVTWTLGRKEKFLRQGTIWRSSENTPEHRIKVAKNIVEKEIKNHFYEEKA